VSECTMVVWVIAPGTEPSVVKAGLSFLRSRRFMMTTRMRTCRWFGQHRMELRVTEPDVVKAGLNFLRNLAFHDDNMVALMAEVPFVRAALIAHWNETGVVKAALRCLRSLALH
jgi:hypothetical protein